MSTIEKRKNGQYRAKVRRYGISETRTFKTRRAAEDWANQVEGRASNGDLPTQRPSATTLEVAIEWFLDRVAPRDSNQPQKCRGHTQHARNQVVLSPEMIAKSNGISLRYLHALFQPEGQSAMTCCCGQTTMPDH